MHAQPTTHTTLLARLADGQDQAAWREFCERYGELIRGFARRQGLQPADSDDVLQDVLMGISRAMPDFHYDPARGTFRNYLKTFIVRAIYRRFRQKHAGGVQLDIEPADRAEGDDPQIERVWEEEWRQHHLRQAMRTVEVEFNAIDRAAFEAYVLQDRDARCTAEALGISLDQVYQAKSRILRRLGQLVERQVQEEG